MGKNTLKGTQVIIKLMTLLKLTSCLLALLIASSCISTEIVPGNAVHIAEPGTYYDEAEYEEEYVPAPVMVYYEGNVAHIFFHPLVARPETAFSSSRRDHYLEWFVTAYEYRKILHELYTGGFVLVDIKDLYDVTYVNGRRRVVSKKPLVPEGKRPIVLSVDDLNYYQNDKKYATVHKLVIDENGGIAAWTDSASGGELSYDLDVVTYLEDFIRRHPGFSVRGARGIIALTGFEGVLGYRTHELNAPGYLEEKQKAIAVANRIKELGWHFSSHSWGHPDLSTIPMARFISDADRWDTEVRPIIGDTELFIYPFGAEVEHLEERHRALRDRGFVIFFGVGSGFCYRVRPEYIYIERRSIDGVFFRTFRNRADSLFNVGRVIDPARTRR
jgi:hypothetical protein